MEVNNENNPHAQGSKDGIEQIDEPHDTSMPASDVWPNNLLSEIETESLSERDRLETIVVLDTVCFFTFSKALGGCHAASRRRGGNTLRPQRRSYVATARFRNTHIRACVRLLKDSLEELKDIANDPTMPNETFSRKKNRELTAIVHVLNKLMALEKARKAAKKFTDAWIEMIADSKEYATLLATYASLGVEGPLVRFKVFGDGVDSEAQLMVWAEEVTAFARDYLIREGELVE